MATYRKLAHQPSARAEKIIAEVDASSESYAFRYGAMCAKLRMLCNQAAEYANQDPEGECRLYELSIGGVDVVASVSPDDDLAIMVNGVDITLMLDERQLDRARDEIARQNREACDEIAIERAELRRAA